MDDFATGFIAGQSDGGSNGNNGWGNGFGGEWLWAIILLACIWGNNGFGGFGGGNGAQGALTRADLCQDMNFGQVQDGVRGIQHGICDSTFALNNTVVNGFNGVSSAICNLGYENAQLSNTTNMNMMQGFNSANVVALQNQNALQTQLAQCCCENRQGQADIKYQMATDTCALQTSLANATRDIVDNQNANYRGLMDFMVQNKIDTLQAENQSLKLAASQQAQNNYLVNTLRPIAQPAYITCNPYTGLYGGYQYGGQSCGCNSGCGC